MNFLSIFIIKIQQVILTLPIPGFTQIIVTKLINKKIFSSFQEGTLNGRKFWGKIRKMYHYFLNNNWNEVNTLIYYLLNLIFLNTLSRFIHKMEADSDGMNEQSRTLSTYSGISALVFILFQLYTSEISNAPTQNEAVSSLPFYENLDLSCGATDTCLIKYNCGLASLLLTLLFALTVKRILAKRGSISLDLKDYLLLCMTLGETTLVFVYYVFYSHPLFLFAAKMGKMFEQVVIDLIILDLTRKYRLNLLKGFIIALVACLMTTALVYFNYHQIFGNVYLTLVAGIEDSFEILSETGVIWALLSTLTLILSLSSFAIGLHLICSDPHWSGGKASPKGKQSSYDLEKQKDLNDGIQIYMERQQEQISQGIRLSVVIAEKKKAKKRKGSLYQPLDISSNS